MIKAAAIKGSHSEIYTLPKPARHANIREMMEAKGVSLTLKHTDGFITDTGKFVDRYSAYKIAKKHGQILPFALDFPGLTLTTEHLW